MDPKTFTLGNMFAMRLHQYGPDISEITNAAIKELTIETELKKLADVWTEQQFDLFKYTKGGMDDRGWILKSMCALPTVACIATKCFCVIALDSMSLTVSSWPRRTCFITACTLATQKEVKNLRVLLLQVK